FKNEKIKSFVETGINNRSMLWQEPVIQISKRFKAGLRVTELVNNGWLNTGCNQVYPDFIPYAHQQRAVEITTYKKENLIITTGTGSGKSICFELPIVSHCIEQASNGIKGIKAIIIYPMNALANTQYEELA